MPCIYSLSHKYYIQLWPNIHIYIYIYTIDFQTVIVFWQPIVFARRKADRKQKEEKGERNREKQNYQSKQPNTKAQNARAKPNQLQGKLRGTNTYWNVVSTCNIGYCLLIHPVASKGGNSYYPLLDRYWIAKDFHQEHVGNGLQERKDCAELPLFPCQLAHSSRAKQ